MGPGLTAALSFSAADILLKVVYAAGMDTLTLVSLRGVLVRYSDQFVRVVQGITDYWFTLAVLPTQKDDG